MRKLSGGAKFFIFLLFSALLSVLALGYIYINDIKIELPKQEINKKDARTK